MNRLILGLGLSACIACAAARPAGAQGTDPFLGEIQSFAFNFCPTGWLPLQGQILAISQYEALFSLLGTTYGGDGVTNFALPKWGPIAMAGGGALTSCIAIFGVYPSRN